MLSQARGNDNKQEIFFTRGSVDTFDQQHLQNDTVITERVGRFLIMENWTVTIFGSRMAKLNVASMRT